MTAEEPKSLSCISRILIEGLVSIAPLSADSNLLRHGQISISAFYVIALTVNTIKSADFREPDVSCDLPASPLLP